MKLLHVLPVFQRLDEEQPAAPYRAGWLFLTRKKSHPVAEAFDSLDDAEWDPPVKSWFIPHRFISDALDLIEELPALCADCRDGQPCDAWAKVPKLNYVIRRAEDLEIPNPNRHEFADIAFTWSEMRGVAEPPPPPPFHNDIPTDFPPPGSNGAAFSEFFKQFFDDIGDLFKPVAPDPLVISATVLGLSWPCTKEQLTVAFKKAALAAHPDRGGSTEQMARINGAREVLAKALAT